MPDITTHCVWTNYSYTPSTLLRTYCVLGMTIGIEATKMSRRWFLASGCSHTGWGEGPVHRRLEQSVLNGPRDLGAQGVGGAIHSWSGEQI